jgi:hypothetical protein
MTRLSITQMTQKTRTETRGQKHSNGMTDIEPGLILLDSARFYSQKHSNGMTDIEPNLSTFKSHRIAVKNTATA